MPDLVIDVRNLTRTFLVGDVEVHALRGVDLSVERGEFVAIMGASGSGKSTLMAILGCLDPPCGGHYFLEGVDVAALAEPELAKLRGERLGFVFQSFNLLARTSAIENVALPLFYSDRASDGGHRLEKARSALKLLGLADREKNTPAQLSGGQQQRVAIARALINGPSVLFADEPTGNLDTKTSHEIMETLVALNRDQGVTIIVVTHESDIAAYAGRVITMRDGLIISDERRTTSAAPAALGPIRERRGRIGGGADFSSARQRRDGRGPRFDAGLRVDDRLRRDPGDRAQQAALGADHARRVHRRRRADRHGGGRQWRERGGAQADREPRHQSRGRASGRGADRRRAGGLWQRLDADRRRRAGDPPRGDDGRARRLSDASDGPGADRQSELDHQYSGGVRQLSARHQLDHRVRPRHHSGGRKERRPRRGDWPHGPKAAVLAWRESARRDNPDQGLSLAGRRRAQPPRGRACGDRIRTIW